MKNEINKRRMHNNSNDKSKKVGGGAQSCVCF